MAENIELKKVSGRLHQVIGWVDGKAVEVSMIDVGAYEQEVMDRMGMTQDDIEDIGRAIVDGHSEGALRGAYSETNDYPMGSTVTFTGNLTVDIERLHDSIRNKSNTVEIGIESAELRELLERGKIAFELWNEFLLHDCCFWLDHESDDYRCCCCSEWGESIDSIGHKPDCIYIQAKKLIEGNQ